MIVIRDDMFGDISRRPELVALSLDFLEETEWPCTPDPEKMWEYLGLCGADPNFTTHCAVDTDTDMIVGYSIGSALHTFSKEPTGYTQFLYVKLEYRNYYTARKLLKATHDSLVDLGCFVIFASSVSDISTRISRAFSGIIRRLGYINEGENYGWRRR